MPTQVSRWGAVQLSSFLSFGATERADGCVCRLPVLVLTLQGCPWCPLRPNSCLSLSPGQIPCQVSLPMTSVECTEVPLAVGITIATCRPENRDS